MKKNFFIILLIILFFVSCKKEKTPEELEQNKLLELVNDVRKKGCKCGNTDMPAVGTLVWSNLLTIAAQNHSLDMSNNDFFSHTGSDGKSPSDRISQTGYKYSTWGENIYMEGGMGNSSSSAENAFNAWLQSEGHCKNIMNGSFTQMGAAKTYNQDRNSTYWTQVFGKPKE